MAKQKQKHKEEQEEVKPNFIKRIFSFNQDQEETELKINELKRRLRILKNTSFSYNAYIILNEILKLRQSQITNYTYGTLAREKGIDLREDKIRYIFGYRFASEESIKLIENNDVNSSLVLYVIRKSSKFREHKTQDKIIKAIINKDIKVTQTSNLSATNIINKIEGNKENEVNEEFMIKILDKVTKLKKQIVEGKNLFKDNTEKRLKERIKNVISELNKIVEGL